MAAIDWLPQLQVADVATGKVTLYDPVTGVPSGVAVLQRATPATASLFARDGTPLMLRAYVVPTDPHTPPQQLRRASLAAAVAAYRADPAAARAIVAGLPARADCTRYQAFIGWYMAQWSPPLAGDWDAGATVWDGGASTWDTIAGTPWDAGASVWDGGASFWDYTAPTTWDNGASIWDAGATTFTT